MRHLGTACFIVIAYLTGMRPGEVLGLRSGCCPDPEPGEDGLTPRHLIHGHVYKTARDDDGNHLSSGVLREVPWVAIAPVVNAIRTLERFVSPGHLLFDNLAHDLVSNRGRYRAGKAIALDTMGNRIEDFVTWVNTEAAVLDRFHEFVPADPHGRIGTRRFRRTLAWHIARRPGGLVALAIQYGHLRTTVSGAYASRSRDGLGDLLDIETARATVDTVTDLHADLADGVGVSARRALNAAATAPRFCGVVITLRTARTILNNPDLGGLRQPQHPADVCLPT
ncbi:hypothetical protein GCM10023196_098870 [Actinoallomurus vinaceus]|uniref:Tyr recombinase domain-containing protein n=1 Tax=Actinoallomurus vinaceus TaxID=1080074 RepID=A0ABP8UU42_9ACTN